MFLRVFVASARCAFLLGFAGLMLSGADVESAAFIMVVSAGPPIVGASVGAGQLARRAARAQPAWNRRRDWLGQGTRLGAISGGALLLLWVEAHRPEWRKARRQIERYEAPRLTRASLERLFEPTECLSQGLFWPG